jgi:hypothetical protein
MKENEKVQVGKVIPIGGNQHVFNESAAKAYNAWLELGCKNEEPIFLPLAGSLGGDSFLPSKIKNALSPRGRVADPGQSFGTTWAVVGSVSDSDPD